MATDRLKKLRTENFPSQTALALAAGIKPARYSRIEKGYCDMREEEIEGLAKALCLTADEVRSGKPGAAQPKAVKTKSPNGMSAARVSEAPPTNPPTVPPPSSPSPTMAAAEPKPSDNLADPKNFSLMPPTELLSHGAQSPSYVATAMGLSHELAQGCIRVSLSVENTQAELETFFSIFRVFHESMGQTAASPH